MKALGGISFVFFAVAWSAMVIFFDNRISPNPVKQIQSQNYASVDGRIADSKVTSYPGPKNNTLYKPLVQYQYKIGPVVYGATRLRYDGAASSTAQWAAEIVRKYPAGKTVPVYFNPRHPGDSVLEKGIGGDTLMLFLILTPFHVVMLGFWAGSFSWIYDKLRKPVAGGASIRKSATRTRVRLSKLSALDSAGLALLALSFGAIFIVGLTTSFHPSYQAALTAWITILVGTLYFAGRRWFKIQTGSEDLIIDEGAKTLSLPLTFGRASRETVDFSNIRTVKVDKLAHSTGRGRTTYSYGPSLRLKQKAAFDTTLTDWHEEPRAIAFAAWLREQLGLPPA